MDYFETIMILDDRLTNTQYDNFMKKYTKAVTDIVCGKVKEINRMGKKKLAYPLKVKHSRESYEANEGYYILITYNADLINISKLEEMLRKDKRVLKFLTVKRSEDEAELDEYAEVPDDRIDEVAKSPAEIIAEASKKSEQESLYTQDMWNRVFDMI